MRRRALVLAFSLGCSSQGGADPSANSVAPSASTVLLTPPSGMREIHAAELGRSAQLLGQPDLSSRDPERRRRAALALARIADAHAHPLLLRMLSDEDPEVVALAAYGLGFDCSHERDKTVSALAARAASLSVGDPKGEAKTRAIVPIARAIGRCASPLSEEILVSWLGAAAAQAEAAALGLGDLAAAHKKLREETVVVLVARAEGGVSDKPLGAALYPFSRLDHVPKSVTERLGSVAQSRLAEASPMRLFAVRALGRARENGVAGLERVLVSERESFTLPERVEAARAAARLGVDGQVLLAKAVESLAQDQAGLARAGVTSTAMRSLLDVSKDAPVAAPVLEKLAQQQPGPSATARDRRAVSRLRCAAARLRSKGDLASAPLRACDLDGGATGKLALVELLEQAKDPGRHRALLSELCADGDIRVRQAALVALGAMPRLEGRCELLLPALEAEAPGVVAAALAVLEKDPNVCARPAPKTKGKGKGKEDQDEAKRPVDERLLPLLGKALERGRKEHDPELLSAAISALGVVGDPSVRDLLAADCASDRASVRQKAAAALSALTGKRTECSAPEGQRVAPPASLREGTVRVKLVTDVGELGLELDAAAAPMLATRVADLVARGYYDGNVIHRVDPSFVVQFGSPFGDGFGGPTDLPPLRCETTPRPFEQGDVGLALAGRDTGSSQLFVMLARHPHLDGQYPWVGKAQGPWEQVEVGDVIQKATLAP